MPIKATFLWVLLNNHQPHIFVAFNAEKSLVIIVRTLYSFIKVWLNNYIRFFKTFASVLVKTNNFVERKTILRWETRARRRFSRGAEETIPLPSPPPDILLADSFRIPFSLTEFPKHKIHEKSQVSFCKALDNKNWHVKEKPRFQLNSHTLAFGLKTHRVESPCTA